MIKSLLALRNIELNPISITLNNAVLNSKITPQL